MKPYWGGYEGRTKVLLPRASKFPVTTLEVPPAAHM